MTAPFILNLAREHNVAPDALHVRINGPFVADWIEGQLDLIVDYEVYLASNEDNAALGKVTCYESLADAQVAAQAIAQTYSLTVETDLVHD